MTYYIGIDISKYDKIRIIRLTARALAEDGQVIPGLWSRFYA